MLSLTGRPQWSTIAGGSARYVEALTAPFADRIRVRTPIAAVTRHPTHVDVVPDGEGAEEFDEVVIAAHADQALALLTDPSAAEAEILGAFPYQPNEAVLHTDRALLPRRRAAWAAWNYHLLAEPRGRCAVTYYMNHLQSLDADRPFCVTLNRTAAIAPEHVIRVIPYAHPVFTREAMAAQRRHAEISGVSAHALLRRLLALGLSRGRRGQRAPGGGAHARAGARVNALYEGWVGHRRLQPVDHRFRYRVFMAYLDLDAVPESVGPAWLWSTSHPALVRFRRSRLPRRPRHPAGRRRPRARRRAHRHAPGRPGAAADQPALPGPPVQPGELLLLLRPRGRGPGGRRRRGDEHAVGRAPRLRPGRARRGRRRARARRQGLPRLALHGHGPRVRAVPHPAGAPPERGDRQPQGRRGALRREPRARARRRSTRPACGASCAASRRRRSPSWRASTPTPCG